MHGVGRSAEVLRVEGGIGVGGAVEEKVIRIGTAAADADGGALAGTPVEGIHVAGGGAVTDVSAGHGENQVDQHAAVQGQGIDGTLVDDGADAGILGLEQLAGGGFHSDALRIGADVQVDVNGGLLADFEVEFRGGLLKSAGFDGQFIRAGLDGRDLIESRGVGNHFALRAGIRRFEMHTRAGNGPVLGIEDRSAHDRVVALRMSWDQGEQQAGCEVETSADHGTPEGLASLNGSKWRSRRKWTRRMHCAPAVF